MPEILAPREEEYEGQQESEQIAPTALATLMRSEHAMMVQTANYPANRRKLAEFQSKLMSYATDSQPIAILMFYSLLRAGKQIIGPSIRLAEIVASCWKNCAVAARRFGESDNTVIAQGVFIDYEQNYRYSVEVSRRITDKEGKRYSEDMINTTANAGMSIARRNVVFGGVAQALWTPAYEAAQLTAVGKAASHAQRVADAMDYLHKLGVTEWQILGAVGVTSVKELETEHLVTLRVLCQEIKKGDKTIEEVFGSTFDKEIESLFTQLKMNNAQQTMLRNSYLGRADQLVAYLRERLGPARSQKSTPEVMSGEPVNTEPFKPAPPVEKTVVVETPDGGTSTATVVSGGAGEPAKRRGRPTLAEMARRKAAEQGVLIEQQPEPSEQEARQEMEDMVEKTDQFAF